MLTKKVIKAKEVDPKSIILMGSPKVGKTKSYEDLYLLGQEYNFDVELIELEKGGARFISGFITEINSVEALKSHIASLIEYKNENKQCYYKIGFIDSLTALEEYCKEIAYEDYIKTPIGADALKKKPHNNNFESIDGQNKYSFLRIRTKQFIDLFCECYDHVVFIGHIKDKYINVDTEEITAKELMLSGKSSTLIPSVVDATGIMYRDTKGKLMVNFNASDQVVIGSRCEHLRGQMFEFDWKKIFLELWKK